MSELPVGWIEKTYGDETLQISTAIKKLKGADYLPEGLYPVIDQGQKFISGYFNNEENAVEIDIPVVVFGDHTRILKFIDFDFVPGADGIKILVPNSYYDPKFFYYLLMSIELPDKGYARHFKYLKEAVVKIPPIAEQKRIVEKLDEVLAQVDTIKTYLDTVLSILKRFRNSVLDSAVSGKLLHKNSAFKASKVGDPWAHTVEAPMHWELYEFKHAVTITGGSQPPKSQFTYEKSDETIRLIQIRDYKSDLYKVFIPIDKARRFCTKDDIMIGRYGPPVFQILRGLEGAYNVALMKAEPCIEELDKEYLYRFLQSPNLFNYIDSGSDRTAGQAGVNKKYLEAYPIFIPPMHEQKEM